MKGRQRSRGIAAIEFALVLGVCVFILAACLYCGRLLMSGAVLDRATVDATRYLATVPVEHMRNDARRAAALLQARMMLETALNDAGIPTQGMYLDFDCGLGDCDDVAPANPLDSVALYVIVHYDDAWSGTGVDISSYAEAGRDN